MASATTINEILSTELHYSGNQDVYLVYGNPAVADVDNDGENEIIINNMWNSHVMIYDLNGVLKYEFPTNFASTTLSASPVIDDLDNDGIKEIIITQSNAKQNGDISISCINSKIKEKQAVIKNFKNTNITKTFNKQNKESGCLNILMEIYYYDGTLKLQIKDYLDDGYLEVSGQAVVADLDLDGDREIVFSSFNASGEALQGQLNAYHHDGKPVTGFPKEYLEYTDDNIPVIKNLDNDDYPEIVFTTTKGIYLYKFTKEKGYTAILNKNDISGSIYATPIITDIYDNKILYIAIKDSFYIKLFDLNLNLIDKSDSLSFSASSSEFAIGEINPNISGKEIIALNDNEFIILNNKLELLTTITNIITTSSGSKYVTSPVLENIDDDSDLEILLAGADGYVHGYNYDGTVPQFFPLQGFDDNDDNIGHVRGLITGFVNNNEKTDIVAITTFRWGSQTQEGEVNTQRLKIWEIDTDDEIGFLDLAINNISLDENSYLGIHLVNYGNIDVNIDKNASHQWPILTIFINDMVTPAWTYNTYTLSDEKKIFLKANSDISIVYPEMLIGENHIKACIDATNRIQEIDDGLLENNNCMEKTLILE